MRLALKFAYDGKKYNGYARQPSLKTVEGELIKSLVKYGFIEDTKESYFRSASRTDKNVSALCNVIAFNTDASKKSIIKNLSKDFLSILVYGIKDVDPDFNPRYAKLRQYRYYLLTADLDVEKIVKNSAYFTGEHNFHNFAKLESFKDPVRTIDNIIFNLENDFLIVDFYAQTFLWHQIRRIMAALIKIGNSKIEKEQIIEALNNPNKNVDFGLAPAETLILKDIIYDFEFEYDKKLLYKLSLFEESIIPKVK
jgi:tRNA pseudouridine38-40 synthase